MLPVIAALINAGLPILASAVLSKGTEVIQEKLGVDITAALGTEEGKISLKQLEVDHEEFLVSAALQNRELDIKELGLHLEDTANARDREVKIVTSDSAPYINKIINPLIAGVVLVLTFLMFWQLLYGGPVEQSRKEIILYILGVLSAISTQIIQYYFGSSSRSAAKDDTINMLQKAQS